VGHVPRRFAIGDFVDNCGCRESIRGFTKGIVCPGVNFVFFGGKRKIALEGGGVATIASARDRNGRQI
jgi:hypothetical protein